MTYSYRFTGLEPRIFADLTHGPDTTVERGGAPLTGPDGEPLDHTVILEPGDLLRTDLLLVHFELDPADPGTAAALAGPAELPKRKPELQELARERGLDDSGTVAELTERLSAPSQE
jgi:hypothetical protein